MSFLSRPGGNGVVLGVVRVRGEGRVGIGDGHLAVRRRGLEDGVGVVPEGEGIDGGQEFIIEKRGGDGGGRGDTISGRLGNQLVMEAVVKNARVHGVRGRGGAGRGGGRGGGARVLYARPRWVLWEGTLKD